MDLVRDILLAVEAKADPAGVSMEEIEIPGHPDSSSRRKHLILMGQAGFFECEKTGSKTNPDRWHHIRIFDLSWTGHEYLDTIRDPVVWKSTKAGAKKVGNLSFEFVIEIAKSYARSALSNAGVPGLA